MKRTTETELNEQEMHLRIFLWMLIEDAQRLLAALDGKMPVLDVHGGKPIPPLERPKGNRMKFLRRVFSRDEEEFLDDNGFKELTRLAVAARVAFRNVMLLRRYGK